MAGGNDKSKKYLSLVLVMYAIKLKSDTENQRCIKDHLGHSTKTWPDIDCGPNGDSICREKETQVRNTAISFERRKFLCLFDEVINDI